MFETSGPGFDVCSLRIERFGYDGLGRLRRVVYPSGRVLEYEYDSGIVDHPSDSAFSHHPTAVRVRDAAGSPWTTLAWDIETMPDGRVLHYEFGDRGQGSFDAQYDLRGQLVSKTYLVHGSAAYDLHISERDGVGNITRWEDRASHRRASYGYDGHERLSSYASRGLRGMPACSYAYREDGSRIAEQCQGAGYGVALSYEPGTQRLAGVDLMAGPECLGPSSVHETLTHDAHGAQEITLPNLYERDWRAVEMNAQGQVASITSPDGVVTSYGYNARRQRTRKERQGVVTHYSYDPSGQLLSETRDGEHTDYVWLNGELLAVLSEAGSYMVASDYVGAPQRLVSWTTGEIAWAADYEPFGRAQVYVPRSVDEPEVELNVRFPGQYYDEESGLHYNWHRYYDPGTGRYLQPDPLIADPAHQVRRIEFALRFQGLHEQGELPASRLVLERWAPGGELFDPIYGYGANNPLSHTDPAGEKFDKVLDLWNKVVCTYYLFKCGDAIQRCREKQDCDPVKRLEGGGPTAGLAGESFANLHQCAKQEPCVDKLITVCGYGIATP